MLEINNTINQKDLTDVYRTFHSNTKEHTSQKLMELPSKLTTYWDTMQVSTDKWKSKYALHPFWMHHGLKLNIHNNKNSRKNYTDMWKLNNSLSKEKWVRIQIKKEINNHLELNKNENTACPKLWDTIK